MHKRFVFLAIFIWILIGCGSSAAYRHMDMLLLKTVEEHTVFSASVALMQDGKTVWHMDYGQDTKKDSLYCIGSISKSFVAALALVLEQEGQISLNNKIGDYLPELHFWNKDSVTLGDLLSMRSGIGDYLSCFDKDDYLQIICLIKD
ncbi:MAG: serine hydrolase domain-containing protein [Christensenellales bacterium]|jgi:CubicO group peptidase (beta-lactamase class C family)